MSDSRDLPDHDEVKPGRLPAARPSGRTRDDGPTLPDNGRERLRAAIASGVASSIPLSAGAAPVDGPATARRPADVDQLAGLLGRRLTPAEVDLARAMLAGPMSFAADPFRHAAFVATELQAWTIARAGGDITANPYGADHPDQELRTVWAVAFARAQAAGATARQAASSAPTARTMRFWNVSNGTTIGTVTLTVVGELEYSNSAARDMLSARVARFGPERAFLSYLGWSNGYVASSEV